MATPREPASRKSNNAFDMSFRNVTADGQDTDNKLFQKIADCLAISMGQRGHDLFAAAGVNTGEWAILHAITAATVTIVRESTTETITLVAGDRIYGKITSVNATSGSVELYRVN